MIIQCDKCQKSYYMRPSHYARHKQHFCSAKCYGLSERGENNPTWKDTNKICPICKKSFKPTRLKDKGEMRYTIFCSKKCSGINRTRKMSIQTKCVICNKGIKVIKALVSKSGENTCSRVCADKLHAKRMTKDGNSNWRGGIGNLPWHYDFNKKLKKNIKDRDNNVCKMCELHNEKLKGKKGYGIQVHHIDYDKQNNKESNLISLCNYCHGKVNYNKTIWQPKLSKLLQK